MRYTTQFLLSAMAAEQFPAPDVPEIAFLGRSNVGKSSLLNTLAGDKAAKVRSTLKLCVCLVDSNVPAQESDRQLIDWLRAAERDFAVVATKIDRLSGNERTRNLLELKKGLELDEVLPVSAKTGYGVKELWTRIE